MAKTAVEWSEKTWNPVTGCTKVSEGCRNCYAEVFSLRLQGMGQAKYRNGFELTTHEDWIEKPYTWRKPTHVFVNSMSDLFHLDVPLEFIRKVFKVMAECPQHTFRVLTKRADIMARYTMDPPDGVPLVWSSNVWAGVTVENEGALWRVDELRKIPAALRFLSLEPLLGPLPGLDLEKIGWVIVGGESGTNPRPMEKHWVDAIQLKCAASKVPFFFKQWGGRSPKKAGSLLNGLEYKERP